MFGWIRRNVRKVGIFGVEVEFNPPAEQPPDQPAPQPSDGHGSESTWYEKWRPTPEVIAVRARYKDAVWAAPTVEEMKRLLEAYWAAEEAAWVAGGQTGWDDAMRAGFQKALHGVRDRRSAVNVIEGVQRNVY